MAASVSRIVGKAMYSLPVGKYFSFTQNPLCLFKPSLRGGHDFWPRWQSKAFHKLQFFDRFGLFPRPKADLLAMTAGTFTACSTNHPNFCSTGESIPFLFYGSPPLF